MSATAFPSAPASCNGLPLGEAAQAYKAGADPADPASNVRYFGTNANGVIFEDLVTLFPTMPEVGEPASGHLLK